MYQNLELSVLLIDLWNFCWKLLWVPIIFIIGYKALNRYPTVTKNIVWTGYIAIRQIIGLLSIAIILNFGIDLEKKVK